MFIKYVKTFLLISLILFSSCSKKEESNTEESELIEEDVDSKGEELVPQEIEEEKEEIYSVKINDEGQTLYKSNGNGYRYGPSIIENEDGSFDIWFAAPGNSGSQWDWITYKHSDDGENWGKESVALKPTPGSKDQCSVCDPGVIFFNDYYYLAYTATSYYQGKGTNNSAFVARSRNPEGPFEKWNGEGWGGYPEPIIEYEGDPSGWGIGEVSFVIKDNELYVYYTYFDELAGSTRLAKSDLAEDWPARLEGDETVCFREHQDSLDIVYVDDLKKFLAFSIFQRMSQNSKLIIYESKDGTNFTIMDYEENYIEQYAHNVGVSKNKEGHISINDHIIIGYGYGQYWGKWSAKIQSISIHKR